MSETTCMILDDEELERNATAAAAVPEWRKEGVALMAARIFGEKEASSPRQFPTAFQTYRPERTMGLLSQQQQPQQRPFPFQMTRRVSATAAVPATPPTSIVRRTESTSPEPRGTLFKAARTVFYNSAKVVQPVPEEDVVMYSPCTPPFSAAATPTHSQTPPLFLDSPKKEESN